MSRSERSLLEQAAELQLPFSEAARSLGFGWSFDAASDACEAVGVPAIDPPIDIGRRTVSEVLVKIMQGGVSSIQVAEWASGILLLDVYRLDAEESPEMQDTLSDILHSLASPSIHGTTTEEGARSFYERLVRVSASTMGGEEEKDSPSAHR